MRPNSHSRIAIIGAGGRAGSAVTAAARTRGHEVAAIVRDTSRHTHLTGLGASVVAGDALNAETLKTATAGADGIVLAVTPFTAPPQSLDGFDAGYYERITENALLAAKSNVVPRLIVIGLFATLRTADGSLVADDEKLLPSWLRPFAAAHAAGVERLRTLGDQVDWLAITPPPHLGHETPTTGRYTLGTDVFDPAAGTSPLSYGDLATAVVDQIDQPTHHREQLAVYAAPPGHSRGI
ncbi:NAD(P)-dependent oxidoreductase [Arthrobacter sp. NPDC090010]|uniref:NAD(P)-dependent oxidoreductase n=1 Tax=Arthrobacter sp. NPDC090010 TaxID=3363942 RepID=UPI003830ECA6